MRQSAALKHSRRREKRGTSARKPIGWERLAASTTPLDAVEATITVRWRAPTPAAPSQRQVLGRCGSCCSASSARGITVDEEVVGEIGKGMLVLVGIHRDSVGQRGQRQWCGVIRQNELLGRRKRAAWKHSVASLKLDVLCVSQFRYAAN